MPDKYYCKKIDNPDDWEDFLLGTKYNIFTQSAQFGESYAKMGESWWIFGVYNEMHELTGGALVVSTHARRGNFLLLPYGPVISNNDSKKEIIQCLFQAIKNLAANSNYSFIRVSPFWENNAENLSLLKHIGARPSPMHVLAENTWILNLDLDENQLLAAMNKNHRNLIRRCEKEGVKTAIKEDTEALASFNSLHDVTASRHGFHRFSKKFIESEFESLGKNKAAVIEAYLPDGQLDSAAIIIFYGNMAAYRHGASLNLNSKIPTSYAIQWRAIIEAKKRGLKWMFFCGAVRRNTPKIIPF